MTHIGRMHYCFKLKHQSADIDEQMEHAPAHFVGPVTAPRSPFSLARPDWLSRMAP
jgi:hypothetical protein